MKNDHPLYTFMPHPLSMAVPLYHHIASEWDTLAVCPLYSYRTIQQKDYCLNLSFSALEQRTCKYIVHIVLWLKKIMENKYIRYPTWEIIYLRMPSGLANYLQYHTNKIRIPQYVRPNKASIPTCSHSTF